MQRKLATELFQEYADAYARGEQPSAIEYLERAGAEERLLETMIDRFLQAVPPRPGPSDAEHVDRLLAEPPLLQARVRRRVTRETVIDTLVSDLGIDTAKREKVADYYHQLETGQLDADRVDQRVFAVLDRLLRTLGRELARWRPPEPTPAAAFYRAEAMVLADALPPGPVEPPDEVDALFTGANQDS